MSLIALVVFLLVVGAVIALVPMDPTIKQVIIVIVVLAVALWILDYFGVFNAGALR